MPTPQKQELVGSEKREVRRSWLQRAVTGKPAGATLIEVGTMLADAQFCDDLRGVCSRCRGWRDPRRSSAEFPNIFCSEACEQEFISSALASVTAEDCIRIQDRLERLLAAAGDPLLKAATDDASFPPE